MADDSHNDTSPLDTSPLNEEETCDICFTSKKLLVAPCGHRACGDCFEHLLLPTYAAPVERQQAISEDSRSIMEFLDDCIIAACPTRGRCPFCRSSIDLFNLACIKSSESGNGVKYIKGKEEENTTTFPYKEEFKIENSSLAGMTFVSTMKHVGEFSFHFPSAESENTEVNSNENISDQESPKNLVPYMDLGNVGEEDDEKLDNGSPLPQRICFEDDMNYHEESNTFRGTIDWMKNGSMFSGSNRWEVIMKFNSDFRHVSNGAIIKYHDKALSAGQQRLSPFEGEWLIKWPRTNDMETTVRVINNTFAYGSTYIIRVPKNGEPPYFAWPGYDGCVQVVESGLDLKGKEDGPDVGETITWTVNHPGYDQITWTRLSKIDTPPMTIGRIGFGGTLKYRRHSASSIQQTSPSYNKSTVWGNTFVQGLRVGYASYHFESSHGEGQNKVYISYEHPDCLYWPPLDNGSQVPSRVHFVDCSFDEETRTFRGKIPWKDAYDTSWDGAACWTYKMVFDSEYTCITSGSIETLSTNGTTERTLYYGEELNYINAAFEKIMKEEVDLLHPMRQSETLFRYFQNTGHRLEEEGATPHTILQIRRLISGSSVEIP